MKTMKIKFLALAIIGSLWMSSCGNDEPKAKGVAIEMKAISNNSTFKSSGRTATSSTASRKNGGFGFVYGTVMLGVKNIEFETSAEDDAEKAKGGEDLNESLEFAGPYAVDLITGKSTPALDLSSVKNATYDELEIALGPVLPDGNTITISFEFPGFGNFKPMKFEFASKEEFEIEIKNQNGFKLDSAGFRKFIVAMNMDVLMQNMD
jgi:hypothetical protein